MQEFGGVGVVSLVELVVANLGIVLKLVADDAGKISIWKIVGLGSIDFIACEVVAFSVLMNLIRHRKKFGCVGIL